MDYLSVLCNLTCFNVWSIYNEREAAVASTLRLNMLYICTFLFLPSLAYDSVAKEII